MDSVAAAKHQLPYVWKFKYSQRLTSEIETTTELLPALKWHTFAQQVQELFVVLRGLVVGVHLALFDLICFAVQHAKLVVLGVVQLLELTQLLSHFLTVDLSMTRVSDSSITY